MALSNFIPDVWSAELLVALERAQVFASPLVVNRNYEGQVRGAGDSVKITGLVDPTIGTYTPHSDITVEDIDDDTRTLLINQAKYFAFEVDDVEASQAAGPVIAEQTRKAGYLLRSAVDSYVAAQILADTASGNKVAEATISAAADAYEVLVSLSQILDEDDVPEDNRFAVVAPEFYSQLLLDNRFVGAGTSGATLANGVVGQAAGFTVAKSNAVPDGPGAGAGKLVVTGHPSAVTYAEGLVEVEADRMEKRFADLVKGLLVYGAKVVRPTALATADIIVS